MTTVREARINAAVDAINEQIELGRLAYDGKAGFRKASVECAAEHVVDALFPDRLLDNIEIDPAPSHRHWQDDD